MLIQFSLLCLCVRVCECECVYFTRRYECYFEKGCRTLCWLLLLVKKWLFFSDVFVHELILPSQIHTRRPRYDAREKRKQLKWIHKRELTNYKKTHTPKKTRLVSIRMGEWEKRSAIIRARRKIKRIKIEVNGFKWTRWERERSKTNSISHQRHVIIYAVSMASIFICHIHIYEACVWMWQCTRCGNFLIFIRHSSSLYCNYHCHCHNLGISRYM